MKISGAKKVHYESGPNMTPLVDVVMVILIFLMLAGSFGSAEHYMIGSAELHSQGVTAHTDPNWVRPVTMDVRVAENGDVTVDWAQGLLIKANDESAPLAQRLSKAISTKFKELQKDPNVIAQGGQPDDHIELIIHASGKVKWELLAPVYDAALQAEVKKIGFI